jgi:hypothetical protein
MYSQFRAVQQGGNNLDDADVFGDVIPEKVRIDTTPLYAVPNLRAGEGGNDESVSRQSFMALENDENNARLNLETIVSRMC